MKHIIISIIAVSMLSSLYMGAQNSRTDGPCSVKVNANIGLGSAYSASSTIDGVGLDKSSNTSFGVDFRYRFWKRGNLSSGINAGLAYSSGSQTIVAKDLNFNYAAGAEADMDGDTYQRYTEIERMSQKVTLGEVVVPVYVDFDWRFSRRVSLYANAGLAFRFATAAKVKGLTGTCDVYGVYPKYDDLKIDDEWLNDFGDHNLNGTVAGKPMQNSFTMSVRAGVGMRVWIYGPVSVECGVGYDRGLTDRLKPGNMSLDEVTADTAPVTYTVADGRSVKSLTSALSGDKLSSLTFNLGLIFNF